MMSDLQPIRINGWRLFAHPLFLGQLGELIDRAAKSKGKDPAAFPKTNAAKMLAAVAKLAFDIIPQNPTRHDYRQGDTLGDDYKHWFRAKFFQQYRLFFRYHAGERIIVYAWVNDEDTKRAYGSKTDAYSVFRKMLGNGNPPDDWQALKAACDKEMVEQLHEALEDVRSLQSISPE